MTESQPQLPGSFILRALALVILIAAADLWVRHHLGWPLGNPAALAATITVLGYGAKTVDKLIGKSVLEAGRTRVADFLRARLSWSFLAVMLLLLLVVAASCSSIVVIPEKPGETGSITVTPVDAPQRQSRRDIGAERPVGRVPVSTSPFGRAFVVAAKGYVPTTFIVYPISGRRVRLAIDVPRVPTLLFRPSALALGLMADGAVFRVLHVGPDGSNEVIAADSGRSASFLLGPPHPITGDMLEGWRLELVADDANPASVANTIRKWRVPVSLQHEDLPLHGRLRAEVLINGSLVASADVELGPGRLFDVPLIDNPELLGLR